MRFYPPAPDLRELLSNYYVLDFQLPQLTDILQVEQTNIRFALAGRYDMTIGGRGGRFDSATLFGPRTRPLTITARGPGRALGVGLLPRGVQAILGTPARELTDTIVDLQDILGGVALQVGDRMREAPTDRDLVEIADDFFRHAAQDRAGSADVFQRAVDAWLKNCDDPQVDRLVAACDLSARQVERLTMQHFGMSPKMLARQGRILRAAAKLRLDPDMAWTDAAGSGFFDQSHFIRDFRALVGMTPTEFRRIKAPATSKGLRARNVQRLISPMSLLS